MDNIFIEKAKIIHGNKYNYDKIDYINNYTKICIICKIHGSFFQTPGNHLSGRGCKICGIQKNTSYATEFIKKANKIHKNQYDYSKVIYINSKTKINIICKIHGQFNQSPSNHLANHGCGKCRKNYMDTPYFIERANKIHNHRYDYSLVEYINAHNNIIIICKIHGPFKQLANGHLNGQGCRKCSIRYSDISIKYLNYISTACNLNIQHAENGGETCIKNSNYKADGYCKKYNIIFSFNGCFWHGCKQCYDENAINHVTKTSYKQLYENTIKRKKFIRKQEYKTITMWEHSWKRMKRDKEFNDDVILKINEFIGKINI